MPPDKGSARTGAGDRGLPARGRSRGYVDYERVAGLYRQGRSLPAEVLDRWGNAVRPYLPGGQLQVVDVGAGTGLFAQAWPRWARARVIAVEPAAEMIRVADIGGPAVRFVRGVAEALPLRDQASDVFWVSTALHHFGRVDRATGEFARVLRGGGRVLVRTYVPGRTEVTFADEFPGRSKWVSRFHDAQELFSVFGAHGFELVTIREVLEWTETYAASAEWVSLMRNADSILTALSDDEIAEGLEILHSNPHRLGRLELTLLVFEQP